MNKKSKARPYFDKPEALQAAAIHAISQGCSAEHIGRVLFELDMVIDFAADQCGQRT